MYGYWWWAALNPSGEDAVLAAGGRWLQSLMVHGKKECPWRVDLDLVCCSLFWEAECRMGDSNALQRQHDHSVSCTSRYILILCDEWRGCLIWGLSAGLSHCCSGSVLFLVISTGGGGASTLLNSPSPYGCPVLFHWYSHGVLESKGLMLKSVVKGVILSCLFDHCLIPCLGAALLVTGISHWHGHSTMQSQTEW